MTERLDLNLLLAFDALMRERSVTRAAARLGLGQPATSAALQRLRALFGDPLFVRTPRGMAPTARAEAVAGTVAAALDQLRATLEPPAFDPATTRRTFTVSEADYLGLVALPALLARLEREAPGIDLRLRFFDKGAVLGALDGGQLDLAVAVLAAVPKHFGVETLLTETFVCVTRGDHPAVVGGLDLERYARLPHVLVTQRQDAVGAVDEALRLRGLSRRVALTVPQVALVPQVLARTQMVATIGRRAARQLAGPHGLALHEPPLPLAPWRLDTIWSRRNDGDPGLAWMRQALRTAVAGADAGADPSA